MSAITVRNKASKSDSSWEANSERNGHETGSAALREGTVRRSKERPQLFNNKMCIHVDLKKNSLFLIAKWDGCDILGNPAVPLRTIFSESPGRGEGPC